MSRRLFAIVAISFVLVVGGLPAQDGIQKGKIKKLDLDRMTITLTQDTKDREFLLTDETRVLDAKGATLKERLQGFKEGAEVMFKPARRDGKDILEGIKLAGPAAGPGDLPKVD